MSEALRIPLTLEALRARRDEILAIAARYGVTNVRVFGSVARGEAGPASDVDFLITAQPGTSMLDLVGLWLDLEDRLGCAISLVPDDREPHRTPFLNKALADAVPL
jgi:hypothetical protein